MPSRREPGARTLSLFALAGLVCAMRLQAAPEVLAEADMSEEQRAIWSLETAIYEHRAVGDVLFYSDLASGAYLGWPWGAEQPFGRERLQRYAESGAFLPGERIVAVSNGIRIDGDTAISYFSTYRTVKPGGEAADQRYENIHVFVRRAGEWRLIASKSRPVEE